MASTYRRGESKRWTVCWQEPDGRRPTRAFPRRDQATAFEARCGLYESAWRAGLHVADADHPLASASSRRGAAGATIAELVADFEAHLRSRGNCRTYVQSQASAARRLLAAAGVAGLAELRAGRVGRRSLAEAIQVAAHDWLAAGRAPRTVNAAVKAARQFGTWLADHRGLAASPCRGLRTYAEQVDVRRVRRVFAEDELLRLIAAAEAGSMLGASRDTRPNERPRGRPRGDPGVSGPDRAMLYRVIAWTGVRRRAGLALAAEDFELSMAAGRTPTVTVRAATAKNKREKVQPLPPAAVPMLRAWLRGRAGPLFGGASAHSRPHLWLQRDLASARAAWLASLPEAERPAAAASDFLRYKDSRGRVADFHAIRHTSITLVAASAGMRAAQEFAGHSSITLTARYVHPDENPAAVTSAVPPLLPAAASPAIPVAPQAARGLETTGQSGDEPASNKNAAAEAAALEKLVETKAKALLGELIAATGLEPVLLSELDFESSASAIPPGRRRGRSR